MCRLNCFTAQLLFVQCESRSASTAGMLWFQLYQQACSKTEQSTADPCIALFLERSHFSVSVTQVQKGRGEGNHSHILSVWALIHWGSCLYTLIWLRLNRRETEQKRREQEKQEVFIFPHICKGRSCGTRVKKQSFSCFVFRLGRWQGGCH